MTSPAGVLYARLLAHARLRHLQLLLAVADHGTLKRAAAQVGISQPAATQAISELERLLEVPLFERQVRGMRVSESGRVVLPVVRQALQALEVSLEALAALQAGANGLLRVGAIPAATASLLAAALPELADRHPQLQLQVFEGTPPHLLNELAAGGLQVLLTRRPESLGSRFIFEPLGTDEAIVVAGPRHPLAGQRQVTREQLADYPWMVPPVGVQARALYEAFVVARPPGTVHPVSTSSPALILALLTDNRTVAMGPASLALPYIREGRLVQLAVEARLPIEGLGAVYPQAMQAQPALQALLHLLRTHARPAGGPAV
jgi:molybdate transport repressor ModE-like protein